MSAAGKHYITNDLAVWERYQVLLPCQYEDCNCYVAQETIEEESHIVYAKTNGDDIYLAALDSAGVNQHRSEDDGIDNDALDAVIECAISTLWLTDRNFPVLTTQL